MMNVTDAIFERLKADTALTAALAVYQGQPAIFSAPPIPEDAPLPFVVINPPFADVPIDALEGEEYREVSRTLSIYFKSTGSALAIELAAELLRNAVHNRQATLTTASTRFLSAFAQGPVDIPSDGSVYGRAVTCIFRVADTS